MTGQWEAYLKRIQRGTAQLEPFLKGIEDYVRDVVGKAPQTTPAATQVPQCGRAPGSANNRHTHRTSARSFRIPPFAPIRKPSAARRLKAGRSAGDADRFRQIALFTSCRASLAAARRW